jgi:hypothetical protein
MLYASGNYGGGRGLDHGGKDHGGKDHGDINEISPIRRDSKEILISVTLAVFATVAQIANALVLDVGHAAHLWISFIIIFVAALLIKPIPSIPVPAKIMGLLSALLTASFVLIVELSPDDPLRIIVSSVVTCFVALGIGPTFHPAK